MLSLCIRSPPAPGSAQTLLLQMPFGSHIPLPSRHLEPRPHARHTHAHTDSHAGTDTLTPARRPRPRPRPGPCGRPLRRSRTRHAAGPGWREAAAWGRFDFPAAQAPRSRSPSRGGGARSRVPSPAAAREETRREAAQPLSSGLARRCLSPTTPTARAPSRPPRPSPSPAPPLPPPPNSPPLCRGRWPRLRESLPAPLRLSPLRPGSLSCLPLSAGPPASSRHPHPLLYPRPPLPPPPFPLSLPTPPLSLSSLLPLPPSPSSGVGGETRVSVAPEQA